MAKNNLDFESQYPIKVEKLLNNEEEQLTRTGDLLNTLGLLRACKINNYKITRNKFEELIKVNYEINELNYSFRQEIDKVWTESIEIFRKMHILRESDESTICILKI